MQNIRYKNRDKLDRAALERSVIQTLISIHLGKNNLFTSFYQNNLSQYSAHCQ